MECAYIFSICGICDQGFSLSDGYRISPPDENGNKEINCLACSRENDIRETEDYLNRQLNKDIGV